MKGFAMKPEKEFVTADLYLASFLRIHLAQSPSFRVESGKTLFIFPTNTTLYGAIGAYNAGTLINAFEYAQQIKRLRGEMLSRRIMEQQNENEKGKINEEHTTK